MTPGNNGASTPEDDDPFGYLYADGQANGAQPPSGGYGYPNSVSRVRAVGERQYGQQQPQQPTAQYGQATAPQQGAFGQPNAHYAAPESFPGGGGPSTGRQQPVGGGRGRGPNTKGLLIGAVAVVAAVVIGIAVAMANGDSDDDKKNQSGNQASTAPSASASASPSESSSGDASEPQTELPKIDAKALRLGGTAALASDVQGAEAAGGIYVGNLNQVGNSVTWSVDGIPEDGTYTLFAHYSAAGENQSMTLTINGKVFGTKLRMDNFTGAADGDFAKGWTTTYSYPTLTKGTNTISISCENGDKCNVLLDQLRLEKGQVKE
ncbi:carbohydrate-binding protein [Streptomyces aurantiogriseus]|uniref:CBM6 domain-containing protein n=1 Tax=Streptomyces aurantiogriseus TaxID=66870 RepID=A0A918FJZ5_9ACTN|nr:carbohydrate-binding protein [Streptomyces aurantiogriseus]GGR44968.1 hypothetical protein GCM10010251_72500 [Streptomyces aurantiogriseus]